jgi:hypothetical protein
MPITICERATVDNALNGATLSDLIVATKAACGPRHEALLIDNVMHASRPEIAEDVVALR